MPSFEPLVQAGWERKAYLCTAALITYEYFLQLDSEVNLFWVFLTLGEAVTMGCFFGIPNEKLIGTNEPFPGVHICADGDPQDGTHWVVYYWVVVIIIETIFLLLALRMAWDHRQSAGGGRLMQQLTRESVLYFIVIFWIYAGNFVLWYINRLTLNELGTSFGFVLPSIFASRLLISVRTIHYKNPTSTGEATLCSTGGEEATIQFFREQREASNAIELTTYNERLGA
ncbi:hypothetical protein BDQ17DRAFT_1425999 [Cyathus striatus]|nr:hypothetical protein BDQ17DRAFT_1425999 [Cyathus striatus]